METSTERTTTRVWCKTLFKSPSGGTQPARIKNAFSLGSLSLVSLEWFNEENELNESYGIWRHYGEPFGVDENDISTY